MQNRQKFITAGVTILAAVATAHLMQRNANSDTRLPPGASARSVQTAGSLTSAPVEIPPIPAPEVTAAARNNVSLVVPIAPPEDSATPVRLPDAGPDLDERMAALDPFVEPEVPPSTLTDAVEPPKRNAFGLTCGLILTAAPRPAAMADLTLTAPCRAGEEVTVSHGNMVFSDRMDDLGRLQRRVPVLTDEAEFSVSFPDGASARTEVSIPSATNVDRVVLQSSGRSGLEIHALEFGAEYGASGHVWRDAPRSAEEAERLGGGFLTRLGDEAVPGGQIAQVYTFPRSSNVRDGVVRLSIEAEITGFNCGEQVEGTTLQRDAEGEMVPVAVTVAMPDCSAVGEFLVLKNLLRDLKIASN